MKAKYEFCLFNYKSYFIDGLPFFYNIGNIKGNIEHIRLISDRSEPNKISKIDFKNQKI